MKHNNVCCGDEAFLFFFFRSFVSFAENKQRQRRAGFVCVTVRQLSRCVEAARKRAASVNQSSTYLPVRQGKLLGAFRFGPLLKSLEFGDNSDGTCDHACDGPSWAKQAAWGPHGPGVFGVGSGGR